MNTQVPVINLFELSENVEFICEILVGRNRMSLRVTTEDHGDFLLIPVIEKSPIPSDVLADLEEMQKALETPLNLSSRSTELAGPPPLDMPF
jgi:hypothetical protein